MNTKEAIQAMLDGKKVRRKSWDFGFFIYFDNSAFRDESGGYYKFFECDDWEIYEEPKSVQTVTIEKWLCKCMFDGEYRIIETSNIKSIDISYEGVKLLDTYEVTL